MIVEITETALIADDEQAARTLSELHDAGVTIALDDFGTGYSSLSRLSEYPVDVVKIDRSFTSRLGSPRGTAVLASIVAVARELSLTVIAEGVETTDQRDRLLDLDCTPGQGYLWGPAVPIEQADWPAGVPLGR